jgi:glycosyltransferase involved in cell wall biosynthesis
MHVAGRRRTYRLAFQALLAVVDAIVVVSHDGERFVRLVGGRATLIRNAVDTDRFRRDQGSDAPPDVVTFIGTVCERKGLTTFA